VIFLNLFIPTYIVSDLTFSSKFLFVCPNEKLFLLYFQHNATRIIYYHYKTAANEKLVAVLNKNQFTEVRLKKITYKLNTN
jgi:hypothetical protein